MYKEIDLQTQEGTKKFAFLATGTTAYRFRQVFHKDLMVTLNNMENLDNGNADTSVGDELAYIMNAQAEKKDLNTLNLEGFLSWADQFDGATLFLHMQEFVSMYLGTRKTTSIPKKEDARQTGK